MGEKSSQINKVLFFHFAIYVHLSCNSDDILGKQKKIYCIKTFGERELSSCVFLSFRQLSQLAFRIHCQVMVIICLRFVEIIFDL